MFCLRCGTEIKDGDSHVYCAGCRKVMERDPVPAGIAIQLPHRPAVPAPKKASRKKDQKPEEQLARLRAANRWLTLALIVSVLAFALTAFVLLRTLGSAEEAPLGRNFRTVTQSDGK